MAKRVPLRVPSGLPGAGRFTSAPKLLRLARTVTDDARLAIVDTLSAAADKQARATTKALRALERDARKFDDDPKRYARARAKSEAAWQRARAREDFLVATAEQVLAPMVEVVPPVVTTPRRRPVEEFYDDYVDEGPEEVEWEMGLTYQAAKGRGSDFDLNLRIRRSDGRPMQHPEAARVMVLFREALDRYSPTMPPGYVIAAIDWRRPGWGSSWASSLTDIGHHLRNFMNPLYAKADEPNVWDVRLGSVK